jgi:hypothetical protein
MQEFPFSQSDWQRVENITARITEACLADDHIVQASLFEELQALLVELRNRYGEHPILIETEADFTDDPLRQMDLYRSAIHLAEINQLPTYTIHISFANILFHGFQNSNQAINELMACELEVSQRADQWEKQEWHELMKECKQCQDSEIGKVNSNDF